MCTRERGDEFDIHDERKTLTVNKEQEEVTEDDSEEEDVIASSKESPPLHSLPPPPSRAGSHRLPETQV
jgi:hypothetical protein